MLLPIREIEHQKQTGKNNCVSTCLSIVTGIPEEEIRKELKKDGFYTPFTVGAAVRFLTRKNIYAERQTGMIQSALFDGRIYLMSCASCISPKMAHMIVGVTINGTVRIIDPADDLESEKIYSSEDFSKDNIPVFEYLLLHNCDLGEI